MTRILFCGDCDGNILLLSKLQSAINAREGPFDLCLCCGRFLPSDEHTLASLKSFFEAKNGDRQSRLQIPQIPSFTIPTYFIDVDSEAAKLIYDNSDHSIIEISQNLYFLGRGEIITLKGIRVAFISGSSGKHSTLSGPFYDHKIIESIVHSARDSPTDIFLSSEWPEGVEEPLNTEQKQELEQLPAREDGKNFKSFTSPEIKNLSKILKPRYHFSALSHIFYQLPRNPAHNDKIPYKFIALGKVGLKGPSRKSFHALDLIGIEEIHLHDSGNKGSKHRIIQKESDNAQEDGSEPPDKKVRLDTSMNSTETEIILVSNIPYELEEGALRKALIKFGDLKYLKFRRNTSGLSNGKAWAAFQSSDSAKAAAKASQLLEVKGRKIKIQLWFGEIPFQKQHQNDHLTTAHLPISEIEINTEPQEDCWFCLSNPNLSKYLLIDIGSNVYLSLAKGGLVPDHTLIIPIKHTPSFFHTDESVRDESQKYLTLLQRIFNSQGKDVIIFERFVPMRAVKAMHSQLHIIPIPNNMAYHAQEIFQKRCSTSKLDLVPIQAQVDGFKQFPSMIKHDSHSSYIYLELPGDLSAKGKQGLRYIVLPQAGIRIQMNFCREVICDLLDIKERHDWRKVQTSEDSDAHMAKHMRQLIRSMLNNN